MDKGYITVNVRTARGALPVEGAQITITSRQDGASYVLYSNADGGSVRLEVPTPPKANSAHPGGSTPYSLFDIVTRKEGFYDIVNSGVPVYPGVTSVQTVEMIPKTAGQTVPKGNLIFDENPPPAL